MHQFTELQAPCTYVYDWAFFTVQDGLNVGLLFGSTVSMLLYCICIKLNCILNDDDTFENMIFTKLLK